MKRALITGINGFVGPYLRRELEGHGYTVVGLGREAQGQENTVYRSVDVTDRSKVAKIIAEIAPTHIFHLAGISSPPTAEHYPERTIQVHVEGTRNILEAAQVPASRILVVSTAHVYGEPQYVPVDEAHPLGGLGAYARSRIAQEALAREFMDDLFIVIPRSFNHTGPGQPDAFVVAKIFKQLAEIKAGKRQAMELGSLDVRRDISDVRDVVRAYRQLLEQDASSIICNVCRGSSISLKEIIDYGTLIARLPPVQIVTDQALARTHDVDDLYGDNRYLKRLIDWEPTIGYDQLFRDIYSYWQAQL